MSEPAFQTLSPSPAPPLVPIASAMTVRPTTTQEEDKHTAGQRRINLVWEFTQAAIALMVVIAAIVTMFRETTPLQSTMASSAFALIVGFYFGRTNHARPET